MEHNRRKCKDVYDRTPNLFTKQEWDRLLSVSCNVAKSKAPESLGVLKAHPTNPVEGCADANPKTMLPSDT